MTFSCGYLMLSYTLQCTIRHPHARLIKIMLLMESQSLYHQQHRAVTCCGACAFLIMSVMQEKMKDDCASEALLDCFAMAR